MKQGQSIVGAYYRLAPKERINLIYKNYSNFPAYIEDYEAELIEMIKDIKAAARRAMLGDLGVRIQTGGLISDPTGNGAVEDVLIEKNISEGVFDFGLYGDIHETDEVRRGIAELKLMKWEYGKFCRGLKKLKPNDYAVIYPYITRAQRLVALSEELSIEFNSANMKIYRIKSKLVANITASFADYDDESILYRS